MGNYGENAKLIFDGVSLQSGDRLYEDVFNCPGFDFIFNFRSESKSGVVISATLSRIWS